MKKLFTTLIFALAAAFTAITPVSAQELTNVKGLDPTLLVGKTCKGGWTDSKSLMGATILTFEQTNNTLTAVSSRRTGKKAFDGQEYREPFENLGPVLTLTVDGTSVNYTTKVGTIHNLTYTDRELKGTIKNQSRTINIAVGLTCS